jgi:hypothetical protein
MRANVDFCGQAGDERMKDATPTLGHGVTLTNRSLGRPKRLRHRAAVPPSD